MSNETVKVRVAVVVDADGQYAAVGASDETEETMLGKREERRDSGGFRDRPAPTEAEAFDDAEGIPF